MITYTSHAPDPCPHIHRTVIAARQCARRRGGGTVVALDEGVERELSAAESRGPGKPALGADARRNRIAVYLDDRETARLDTLREAGESRGACLVRRAGIR